MNGNCCKYINDNKINEIKDNCEYNNLTLYSLVMIKIDDSIREIDSVHL